MDWHPFDSAIRPAKDELILVRFKYRKSYTVYRYLGNDKWAWMNHNSILSLPQMLIRYSYWCSIIDPE